jgi:hypothetical protein
MNFVKNLSMTNQKIELRAIGIICCMNREKRENQNVSRNFYVQCRVTSNKDWHTGLCCLQVEMELINKLVLPIILWI